MLDYIDEKQIQSFQLIAIEWRLNVVGWRLLSSFTSTVMYILLEGQSKHFVATEIILSHSEMFCKVLYILTKIQGYFLIFSLKIKLKTISVSFIFFVDYTFHFFFF